MHGSLIPRAWVLRGFPFFGFGTGHRDTHLSFNSDLVGGTFHFLRFETARTAHAIAMIKAAVPAHAIRTVHATGGGAHKFRDMFRAQLGIELLPRDELETVLRGIAFLITSVTARCKNFPQEKHFLFHRSQRTGLDWHCNDHP